MLHFLVLFLISVETAKNIPLPIPKMHNSTAISVTLPSRPYLPPRDQWIYIQKHEVLYHRSGVDEPVKIIEINEPLPKTVVATGLNKYTDYVFYARYYGKIDGEDQNIITRYSAVMKTDEDGMKILFALASFSLSMSNSLIECRETKRTVSIFPFSFSGIFRYSIYCLC